ncbi:CHRD domain-containing protein [Lysobacter koreensis]|uniref:CHRD domain-containing protein n=1 Tax=Lysobacter koreensis TaxID=266122 RepID=A0ABW2YPN9_9GAMM
MKPFVVPTTILAAILVALMATPLAASAENVRVSLIPFEEVPSVSSAARGSFKADIDSRASQIAYDLEYSGLTGDVRQAHIHFGQRNVNGGISVFLCQTATNPDPTGLAPACPASGRVSGVLTIANVVGPAGQGIAAGEFAELVAAIRDGVAYVNVHSSTFPGGEVRGQLNGRRNLLPPPGH